MNAALCELKICGAWLCKYPLDFSEIALDLAGTQGRPQRHAAQILEGEGHHKALL